MNPNESTVDSHGRCRIPDNACRTSRPWAAYSAPTTNDTTIPEQDWYFTFGSGQQHDGKYVRITGTAFTARDEMARHFGNRWSFQYPTADAAGVDEFGLVELPRNEWPLPVNTSDEQCPTCWVLPGETHELSCEQVTPEQALAFINATTGGTR